MSNGTNTGGHLIAGQTSSVAFKALAATGERVAIKGELYDSKNNLLTTFSTYHDGMGSIYFQPQPGERYHAVCEYGGRQIEVSLPEVKNNTAALKTSWRKNELWVNVNKPDNFNMPPLYLIIHTRGHLVYAGLWDEQKEVLIVDKAEFSSGISHVLLLTADYQLVSERLVFALNDDQAEAAIVTDRETYAVREKVQVDFALPDTAAGSFAVSVIDARDIQLDEQAPTILSSVLLTSDLRGYIHNPAFYLKNNKQAILAADLLMMTQGWTRYDIPKALRGDFQHPTILPEKIQTLSGMVTAGLLAKPSAGAKVTFAYPSTSSFIVGETDEAGKFLFTVEAPDSAEFLLRAGNSKGNKGAMMELVVDKPVYPAVNPKLNLLTAQNSTDTTDLRDYAAKADAKYRQEGGMRLIDLEEVVVKGKKPEEKYKSVYTSTFDYNLTEEQLDEMRGKTIQNILNRLPGVRASGSDISIRQSEGPPLIVIDGTYMNSGMDGQQTMDMLNSINVLDIGQVSVVKGAQSIVYGPEGANGVIEIFSKRGILNPVMKPQLHIKRLMPLGYQQPVEFYAPKYDTPEAKANTTPDLRSVIHWQPDVRIDAGKASFEFYTSDSPSTYTILIEGATNDGKLVYYKGEQAISVK